MTTIYKEEQKEGKRGARRERRRPMAFLLFTN